MSHQKFSIGHVFGLGFSVISFLVAIFQYNDRRDNRPKVDPNLLGAVLGIHANTPTINPFHVNVFGSYSWADSFPFFLQPLVDNGIRFIQIERYALPESKAGTASNLELGPEAGERDLLVDYTFDPQKRMLRSLRRRSFHPSFTPDTVVRDFDSETISFEIGYQGDYPNFDRTFSEGGRVATWRGRWKMQQDTLPLEFTLNGNPVRKYHAASGAMACIELDNENSMHVLLPKTRMGKAKMLQLAKSVKASAMAKTGVSEIKHWWVSEPREPGELTLLSFLMDAKDQVTLAVQLEMDSIGRPRFVTELASPAGDTVASTAYAYGNRGELVRMVRKAGDIEETRLFRYTNSGWPERLLHYEVRSDGQMRIISRTFFKFRQR